MWKLAKKQSLIWVVVFHLISLSDQAQAEAWNNPQTQLSAQFSAGSRMVKTTAEDCEIRGGEYFSHDDLRPGDMVDCNLPSRVRKLGKHDTYSGQRRVFVSVYDYLYRTGVESKRFGLYSYVLFPNGSPRSQAFAEELFKTTSSVELSQIAAENLNIMYLPTRGDRLESLIPLVADGSPPPVSSFMTKYYDYALARRILVQICRVPLESTRSVCETDLSRGPYLFTYSQPASALDQLSPPYLFLDLSQIHTAAFGEFIAAYKEQIKRADYTDRERLDGLRLRLLSIVLTASDWMQPVASALADIVHFAESE